MNDAEMIDAATDVVDRLAGAAAIAWHVETGQTDHLVDTEYPVSLDHRLGTTARPVGVAA